MEPTLNARKKIFCVVGTRPEAIKMAPVILQLQSKAWWDITVVSTGQHREMTRQTLELFDISIDIDLDLMTPNQRLSKLAGRILTDFDEILEIERPALVVAQGDTTTVMAISLACFHAKVPFAHVEAGLRTHDFANPFPEEFNRRIASISAQMHFAPTAKAKQNLLDEKILDSTIFLTGNTVIDALLMFVEKPQSGTIKERIILVTTHRRENFGDPLKDICSSIKLIQNKFNDVKFVIPVHPNPNVKSIIYGELENLDRVNLIEPVAYNILAKLMSEATIILTDSGGIQEEAPALAKPVLVMRTETERPEAIEFGVAKLVGTNIETIVNEVSELLMSPQYYARMASGASPYGDGKAAQRIAAQCARYLGIDINDDGDFSEFACVPSKIASGCI